MLTLDTYENYFEHEIVDKYSKLKGFIPVDMFEFDTFLNTLKQCLIKTPVLILEPYQLNTIANKSDNIHNAIKGRLIVLGFFDVKTKSAANKTAFLAEMEDIVFQIRCKMIEHSKKACHVMYGLIPESISISKTELIAGNHQGYAMDFAINDVDETELDENWINS